MIANTLIHFQKLISSEALLAKSKFTNIEFDEILDLRDGDEFDSNWTRIYKELCSINKPSTYSDSECDSIRENVFKHVFAFTQSNELSSYISDDFELFYLAVNMNYSNNWLNGLFAEYLCKSILSFTILPCDESIINQLSRIKSL